MELYSLQYLARAPVAFEGLAEMAVALSTKREYVLRRLASIIAPC